MLDPFGGYLIPRNGNPAKRVFALTKSMTKNQQAMLWVTITYLVAFESLVQLHSTDFWLYFLWLIVIPGVVYVVARFWETMWRTRIIVLPYQQFTPRCLLCESKDLPYTIERVASRVIERWDTMHKHSVEVKNSEHLECGRGHFVEFRKMPTQQRRKSSKGGLAKYLRALRMGFHKMHVEDKPALDTQG